MKVKPDDGSIVWEMLWRPEWPKAFLAKHNATGYGLDVAGGRVFVTGAAGNTNGVRYHGYWYDRAVALEDYAPAIAPVAVPADQILPVATGAVRPAADSRSYGDAPAALILQEATAKHDGKGPDGDIFLMRMPLR